MVNTVLAQKKNMHQVWTADGKRLVVTKLFMGGNTVTRVLADQSAQNVQDGTDQSDTTPIRVQVAFGDKKLKNMNKAQGDQLAKLNIKTGKRKFKEALATETLEAGRVLLVQEVLQPGDVIRVTGMGKGHGFSGVVKRWGFAGGPRTHGQSDRERAPGSIGAGTTPGRVWPGKKMPGNYGNDAVTLENVVVVAVDSADQAVWVRGTLPGSYNSLITIRKQGEVREISPLNDMSKALLSLHEELEEVQTETETVEAKSEVTETQE